MKTTRPTLITLATTLLAAIGLATPLGASASTSGPQPGPSVYASTCTAVITKDGVGIDAASTCTGVKSITTNSAGQLVASQTLTDPGGTPIIAVTGDGAGKLAGKVLLGPSGGTGTTRFSVYSTDAGRLLKLNSSADRAVLAKAGGKVTLRWMHHNAAGQKHDIPTLGSDTYASGCVVRFLVADGGRPSIHANASHLCAGVDQVGIDANGSLFADHAASAERQAKTTWPTGDEMFAIRGIQLKVAAQSPSRTTYSMVHLASGKTLNLNSSADRAKIAGDTTNAWLGWTHTQADTKNPAPAPGGKASRIAGEDRYETAAKIAAASFPSGVPTVYVATGVNHPDALAVAGIAGAAKAPVLLTKADAVPRATQGALRALAPSRIVLVGSPGAVDNTVQRTLATFAPVTRIGGDDRYQTAVALSKNSFPKGASTVLLTTGADFPDALAASAVAGAYRYPVLLTRGDKLTNTTAAELRRLAPTQIVVVGSPVVVNRSVTDALSAAGHRWTQISGTDRYDTASQLATRYLPKASSVYVATGRNFPDALAASAVAGAKGAPVLLVRGDIVTNPTTKAMKTLAPARATVVGGEVTVTDTVKNAISGLLR